MPVETVYSSLWARRHRLLRAQQQVAPFVGVMIIIFNNTQNRNEAKWDYAKWYLLVFRGKVTRVMVRAHVSKIFIK